MIYPNLLQQNLVNYMIKKFKSASEPEALAMPLSSFSSTNFYSYPEPSIQGSASRVQRPEPGVQLLHPEPRNSSMPSFFLHISLLALLHLILPLFIYYNFLVVPHSLLFYLLVFVLQFSSDNLFSDEFFLFFSLIPFWWWKLYIFNVIVMWSKYIFCNALYLVFLPCIFQMQ